VSVLLHGANFILVNRQIPQDLVFLPQFLEDFVPPSMRFAVLSEGSFIGGVPGLLGGVAGDVVVGMDLSDGLVVVGVIIVGVGGVVLVDFLKGFLHFYLGTGQHECQIVISIIANSMNKSQ
jgi:hypothetical protein